MAIPINKLSSLVSRFVKTNPKKPLETESVRRLGLNIGRANFVASEISSNEGKYTLERCARRPIIQEKPFSEQLKSFLAESGFKSKRASISIKGQGVVVRFLSFPKMSRSEFASSIRYEAEKYLPFSLSEVELDYHIINETTSKSNEDGATMSVILVAARKSEVERLIQTVQDAGLKPDLIDVDLFACSNAFQHAKPDAKDHCVGFIDLGAGDSSFGILDKGTLVFSRDIAFGGADLTEMIHRKLNVSAEEAFQIQAQLDPSQTDKVAIATEGLSRLFQEIKSSIIYYYNQHQTAAPLETIYLSGGFSQFTILSKSLQEQLELPISTWNPLDQINLGQEINQDTLKELIPYLPVSIGLAIRSK